MLHAESITVTAVRAAPTSKGHQMSRSVPVVVTGASGFTGGHLVRELQQRGHGHNRTVDVRLLDEGARSSPVSTSKRAISASSRTAASAQYRNGTGLTQASAGPIACFDRLPRSDDRRSQHRRIERHSPTAIGGYGVRRAISATPHVSE